MADAIRVSRSRSMRPDSRCPSRPASSRPRPTARCSSSVGDTTLLTTVVTSEARARASTSSRSPSTSRSACTPPGKIPGSFFRREGRPGEPAILTCRLTDRPLRPSFPEGFRNEVQVVATDPRRRPREPARRRVDQRRVGRAHGVGHPVRRPDRRGAPVAPRQRVDRAPHLRGERRVDLRARRRRSQDRRRRHRHHDGGGRWHRGHLAALRRGRAEGRPKRSSPTASKRPSSGSRASIELQNRARAEVVAKAHGPIADDPLRGPRRLRRRRVRRGRRAGHARARRRGDGHRRQDRAQRRASTRSTRDCCSRSSARDDEPQPFADAAPSRSSAAFRSLQKQVVRSRIVNEGVRIDGRGTADIRPLSAEVDLLPTAHGTGLFQRGETQVLSVLTLGMPRMEQLIDPIELDDQEALHPPLQLPALLHRRDRPGGLAEAPRDRPRRARRAGAACRSSRRRGVALHAAHRLRRARSNGSTSMASVCGSTLSLMDARRADQGAGRRHRHGPRLRRGQVHDPHRHPRHRGRVRRHGLQGRRHPRLRHRAAARHEDRRPPGRRARAGAAPGQRRPAEDPRRDGRRDRRAPRRREAHRAEDRQLRDPDGQDRRGDRAQGQGHQHDHRRRPAPTCR